MSATHPPRQIITVQLPVTTLLASAKSTVVLATIDLMSVPGQRITLYRMNVNLLNHDGGAAAIQISQVAVNLNFLRASGGAIQVYNLPFGSVQQLPFTLPGIVNGSWIGAVTFPPEEIDGIDFGAFNTLRVVTFCDIVNLDAANPHAFTAASNVVFDYKPTE